ncbi:hypothetical protein GCM10020369_84250 [Cryptosporangium minutisporangium]|uniref:Uncharacterized protein n=1 Tax=Cryptosporangium minutisporangium TaxID=113569 RepID=A0ABP6TE60_9ACTN
MPSGSMTSEQPRSTAGSYESAAAITAVDGLHSPKSTADASSQTPTADFCSREAITPRSALWLARIVAAL